MKKYVVGFAFSELGNLVALIKKTKPEWQAGHLNGIGGKIEEGEYPTVAMVREFEEETGVQTNETEWMYVTRMVGDDYSVDVYRAFLEDDKMMSLNTMEEEEVSVLNVNDYIKDSLWGGAPTSIHNVPALIVMCLSDYHPPHEIMYRGTP